MLHDKAVKKVEKALGVKVEKMGHRWGCVYDGQVISWISSPGWKREGDRIVDGPLEASNWHIRNIDDHTDSMVDYFAGSFRDNLTQLINAVKPPEPKYPVGTLVRGKDNKRAKRQGYAGRLGIVTNAGQYMYLNWADGKQDSYRISYPERDFERV